MTRAIIELTEWRKQFDNEGRGAVGDKDHLYLKPKKFESWAAAVISIDERLTEDRNLIIGLVEELANVHERQDAMQDSIQALAVNVDSNTHALAEFGRELKQLKGMVQVSRQHGQAGTFHHRPSPEPGAVGCCPPLHMQHPRMPITAFGAPPPSLLAPGHGGWGPANPGSGALVPVGGAGVGGTSESGSGLFRGAGAPVGAAWGGGMVPSGMGPPPPMFGHPTQPYPQPPLHLAPPSQAPPPYPQHIFSQPWQAPPPYFPPPSHFGQPWQAPPPPYLRPPLMMPAPAQPHPSYTHAPFPHAPPAQPASSSPQGSSLGPAAGPLQQTHSQVGAVNQVRGSRSCTCLCLSSHCGPELRL